MSPFELLGGSSEAVATIGFVLAEAVLLYGCYGAVIRLVGPIAKTVLEGQ